MSYLWYDAGMRGRNAGNWEGFFRSVVSNQTIDYYFATTLQEVRSTEECKMVPITMVKSFLPSLDLFIAHS